jgi:hypothetical protein
MANANLRVVGHFSADGKTLTSWGTVQYNLSVSILGGSPTGDARPDPASIASVMSSNGKVPSGATFNVDGYANLDHEHGSGILS